jgi:sulfite exporter TauE/SafE
MWALSYIVVALIAPGIGGSPAWQSAVSFLAFGIALLAATMLKSYSESINKQTLGKYILMFLAGLSVYSGIASWTGVALWIVPFANKEIFQVSMAFADLLGAAFMLYLALDEK